MHSFILTASGTGTGYVVIKIGEKEYTTAQIDADNSITVKIKARQNTEIEFETHMGESEQFTDGNIETLTEDGETIFYTFAGLKISTMGDSISTYTGWSDASL